MALSRVAGWGCVLVVAAAPVRASAQSAQPWSLQALFLEASQKVGGQLISGGGFEGQLRYSPGVWSFGLGYQYSTHKSSSGQTKINISGVFLEPRYAIDIGSDRVAPYLAGRLAYLHQSTTLDIGSVSSSGSAFGAGGGVIIRASSTVNVDIGAAFIRQSFSDAETDNAQTVTFPAFTGYVAKVGLSIGFGHR